KRRWTVLPASDTRSINRRKMYGQTGHRAPAGTHPRGDANSDPDRAAEPPRGIVRFRAVVIQEDSAVAAIAKQGADVLPDIRRRFHPARRFRIELSQPLQIPVLILR